MDQIRRSSRYRYPQVTEVAAILVTARHFLPWELEAPVRHWIRTMLVLQGMAWARADWIGNGLVARGRIENGTRQPGGWDSDSELAEWLPAQEYLVCGKPFCRRYADQVFCCTNCANRHAEMEAWCIARVRQVGPPQCRYCRSWMEVDNPAQEYCNQRCRNRAHAIEQFELADAELAPKSLPHASLGA